MLCKQFENDFWLDDHCALETANYVAVCTKNATVHIGDFLQNESCADSEYVWSGNVSFFDRNISFRLCPNATVQTRFGV